MDYDTLTPTDMPRRAAGQGRRHRLAVAVDRDPPRHQVHGHRRRLHLRRSEGQRRDHAARQRLHAAGARPGRGRHARARDPARRLPPRDGQPVLGHGQRRQDAQAGRADQQPLRRPRPAHHQVRSAAGRRRRQRAPGRERHGHRDVPDADHDRGLRALEQRRDAQRRRRLLRRPDDVDDDLAARPAGRRGEPGHVPVRLVHDPVRRRDDRARRHLHRDRPGLQRPRHRRRLARRGAAAQPLAPDHRDGLRGGPQLQPQQGRVPLEPEPGARHHRLRGLGLGPRQHPRQRQRHARVPDGQRGRHELHGRRCPGATPRTTSSRSTAPTSRTRAARCAGRSTRRSRRSPRPSPTARTRCSSSRISRRASRSSPGRTRTRRGALLPHLPRRLLLAGRPLRPDGDERDLVHRPVRADPACTATG